MRLLFVVGVCLLGGRASAEELVPPARLLEQVKREADLTFDAGLIYWAAGGALLATGVVTLALSNPAGNTPSDRLGLVSGSATIVSGLSSCFSAWPRTVEPFILARNIAAHGGEPAVSPEMVRQILAEHAEWSRRWRRRTLVVTTALLAVNAVALTWYSLRYSYERTSTAIVAGLYGIGVPIVLWYDSLPWFEEVASDQAQAQREATAPRVQVQPAVLRSAGDTVVALTLTATW